MEDFLNTTGTPGHGVPYDGEVKYGPRAEQIAESIHVAAMFACFNRIANAFRLPSQDMLKHFHETGLSQHGEETHL